jgi:peroxiredoxin
VADLGSLRANASADWPLPVLVSTGPADANRKLFEASGLTVPVLLQEEMEVGALIEVPATPAAYLVDEDGKTASPLVAGRAAVLGLAASSDLDADGAWALAPTSPEAAAAVTTPAPANGARYQGGGLDIGAVAPDFRLPGLNGDHLALGRHRGRPVLLVFADPICPPCEDLLPALEAMAREGTAPPTIVVSRGDLETNRAWADRLGLNLPIALQRRWDLSREYGLLATPVGFLLDKRGVIARPVALGTDEILALAAEAGAGAEPRQST